MSLKKRYFWFLCQTNQIKKTDILQFQQLYCPGLVNTLKLIYILIFTKIIHTVSSIATCGAAFSCTWMYPFSITWIRRKKCSTINNFFNESSIYTTLGITRIGIIILKAFWDKKTIVSVLQTNFLFCRTFDFVLCRQSYCVWSPRNNVVPN